MLNFYIPLADVIAAGVFFICWFGYGFAAERAARNRPSLITAIQSFRRAWIERMCTSDNHVADAALLGNLLRGALFFASTTVFILGGLAALLGTAPKLADVVSQLPYSPSADPRLAEIKILTLILFYVYAFFKFTWSAWQYNVLSIMVGAMPAHGSAAKLRPGFSEAGINVASLAGDSYNAGIRSYYFSIALMAWLIHPLLCLMTTLAITIVLYRREFYSPMLRALQKVQA
ncbi:MAG: DUF599 domain-containing protein [Hyphomicrobium sp.]|nr:DUF599 domain-containing protein [Hyphomicrobium sp.]